MVQQECLAKSKEAKLKITAKEKYGSETVFDNLTVLMRYEDSFYLVGREGTRAILPVCNWAIIKIEGKEE